MTTDKLTLTAARAAVVLTDALVFTSSDQARPVLNAIKLTAAGGRAQAVATDSYVLGTFTFDAEGELDALISADDVKRIIVLAKAEAKAYRAIPSTELVLERDGDCLTVRGRDGSITCRLVYGEFPPAWRTLFDASPTDGRFALSPHVLGKLAKVTLGYRETAKDRQRAGVGTGPALVFDARGNLKPSHFAMTHDGIVFRGLFMPSRRDTMPDLEAPELVEGGAR